MFRPSASPALRLGARAGSLVMTVGGSTSSGDESPARNDATQPKKKRRIAEASF
jgi:hypothetical protein